MAWYSVWFIGWFCAIRYNFLGLASIAPTNKMFGYRQHSFLSEPFIRKKRHSHEMSHSDLWFKTDLPSWLVFEKKLWLSSEKCLHEGLIGPPFTVWAGLLISYKICRFPKSNINAQCLAESLNLAKDVARATGVRYMETLHFLSNWSYSGKNESVSFWEPNPDMILKDESQKIHSCIFSVYLHWYFWSAVY